MVMNSLFTSDSPTAAACGPIDRKPIRKPPYNYYVTSIIVLCLVGTSFCAYLAVSHYKVYTDLAYQSFCALTRSINCDTVSQSPYSVLAGAPVSVWGIFGYGFFIVLVLGSNLTAQPVPRMWAISQATALAFCMVSFAFAAVSSLLINSYCIVCIATYAINFALFFTTWIIRRRFHNGGFLPALSEDFRFLWAKRAVVLPMLTAFSVGLAATGMAFPAYWKVLPADSKQRILVGLYDDGAPWIGAANPVVEIVEFTDYKCFQCRKMHYYLRNLIALYPEKIRLTHRNYPMDHKFNPIVTAPFHVGSGQMALLSIHAAMTGKFLEMNDLLFRKAAEGKNIELEAVAKEIGSDQNLGLSLVSAFYHQHLMRDIRYGMKLRVTGTPAFLIDGSVYTGSIPEEVLRVIIARAETKSVAIN
jgi:protein-disulfide isomerase/uncharacterized membrane protein